MYPPLSATGNFGVLGVVQPLGPIFGLPESNVSGSQIAIQQPQHFNDGVPAAPNVTQVLSDADQRAGFAEETARRNYTLLQTRQETAVNK